MTCKVCELYPGFCTKHNDLEEDNEMNITDKMVLFWDGPYSNFEPCEIKLEGKTFSSSEQAFMYYKALTFDSKEIAKQILATSKPAEAKRLGRKIIGYDDDKWSKVRYDVMLKVCRAKYSQNERLKQKLLQYKGLMFVEASPVDKIWGIGLGQDDTRALDISKWNGQNLLGKVLNEVQAELLA